MFDAERAFHDQWVPPWVRHQTLGRYQWAATFVAGKKVIEVACGTGEGSVLLKQGGASEVHGWDRSPEAIEEARRRHAQVGVAFEVGDAQRLPVPGGSYDVYVSFETIEHLPEDNAYLAEARRVLKSGGIFLCSTPNRRVTNAGKSLADKPFNPFHLREYTRAELQSLLQPHFARVEFFGQSTYSSRYVHLLDRAGRISPALSVRVHQCRKLAALPWDRADRHYPTPWKEDDEEREIVIAVADR